MNAIDRSRGWKSVLFIIIPYFVVTGIFQLIGLYAAGVDFRRYDPGIPLGTADTFIIMLFNLAGTVLVIWLFRKHVDRRSFRSLGFEPVYVTKDILIGLLFGFVMMLAGFSGLLLGRQIEVAGVDFNIADLMLNIGFLLFVAISEELLIRGYVLNNLLVSFNKSVALLVSSLLFALMHGFNPNLSPLGMVDLFIGGGLVFGLAYIYTRTLWFPIALHFSWNFFQGTVFGFNVSGQDTYSLVVTRYDTANIWNGGAFGFEGSIVSILLEFVAIGVLIVLFKDRRHYDAPSVKRAQPPLPH